MAAVPSNCTVVLERIENGQEEKNYNASYRAAQRIIDSELAATFDARVRAYLLLKRHGQELCKPTNPKCNECPVRAACAFVNRRPTTDHLTPVHYRSQRDYCCSYPEWNRTRRPSPVMNNTARITAAKIHPQLRSISGICISLLEI